MKQCTGCRVRHLTCDENKASCAHCVKAGRDCVRGYNVRFRNLVCPVGKGLHPADYSKYEFVFDEHQIWPDVQDKLEFVTEEGSDAVYSRVDNRLDTIVRKELCHAAVSTDSEHGSNTPLGAADNFVDASAPEEFCHTTVSEDAYHGSNNSLLAADVGSMIASSTDEIQKGADNCNSPHDGSQVSSRLKGTGTLKQKDLIAVTYSCDHGEAFCPPLESKALLQPSNIQSWPLRSLKEVKLLQHFVENLAPWFDAIDSKRHFSRVVPRLAASSPLLMNSVLAIAALHLSHISDHDPYDNVQYHDQCLELLVPMLNDDDMIKDDALLLTTVILHLYEDLDVGLDSSRHIQGTSRILAAHGACRYSQLRTAVYWGNLRQEIYAAAVAQRPVQADLDDLKSSGSIASFDAADDEIWCHRTLWICAHVLQWAYSEEPTHARWRDLCHLVEEWERLRPSTFDALYFRQRNPKEGRWVPEICLVTDEHVVGIHFLYIAKVHLTAHDPTIPRMGPRSKLAMAAMQETTLSYVRTMIGIALCSSYIPARFSASLAICICGFWFTDREEQGRLIDFMRETERKSGCPREKAVKILIDDWGTL